MILAKNWPKTAKSLWQCSFKAQADGFNVRPILLNAVERLLYDADRRDGKWFQHFIQLNFASVLVISSSPRMDHSYV